MPRPNPIFILAFAAGLFFTQASKAQVMLPSFADLIEQLSPSVVNISTIQKETYDEQDGTMLDGTDTTHQSSSHNALGSGFIIDTEGYILTNAHVIENASDISVIMSDNNVLPASVIGLDNKTDLALIKITSSQTLQPAKIGDSDKIRVGDWVLAIGNPFGLGGSVTAGIISAKSRDIESGPYDNFIQTDASINQGSSGGPMFNLNGEVIGVNTAIFSTTGSSMGVGFAIPINLTRFVIDQLKANGEVKRGWIGVRIQPNSLDLSQSLGSDQKQGVVVSGVTQGASAAKAGIKAGDIILSFDNIAIDNTKNFSRMVAETDIGKIIPLKIWRDQKELAINVLIETMPASAHQPKRLETLGSDQDMPADTQILDTAGITIGNIDKDTLDKFQLPSASRGVIITSVEARSDAMNKGLKSGDIIRQIDRKEIFNIDDAKNHITDAIMEDYRPILLTIQNGEDIHFVAIKLKRK